MKGGKHTAAEKLGIAVLGVGLWIVTAALGCAIAFDLWILKPALLPVTSPAQQWLIGLWKSCLIPEQKPGKINLRSFSWSSGAAMNHDCAMYYIEIYRNRVRLYQCLVTVPLVEIINEVSTAIVSAEYQSISAFDN